MDGGKKFHCCSLCGKKLIERKENGILVFVFGRGRGREIFVPVEMQIYGSIRMRCLRRSCRSDNPDHWEVISLFPFVLQSGETRTESPAVGKQIN
jgi:hypothetical protein